MSAFSTSTQARHWLFTPAALAAAHLQRCSSAAAGNASSSSSSAPSGHKRSRPSDEGEGGPKRARTDGSGEPAALAEEQNLLDWCSLALQRMCCAAQLDRAVTATAHAYLRRYFVRGLFTHYPPHEMLCVGVWGCCYTCHLRLLPRSH